MKINCFENIRFYAGIYGLSNQKIKERSEMLIEKLGLGDVKKTLLNHCHSAGSKSWHFLLL